MPDFLHRIGQRIAPIWFHPLTVLLMITTLTLIRFDRPLVRGDGLAYLAWADTFVLDRDIDLNNQWERLQPANTYHVAWNFKTQRRVIVFPFGTAILQAPFYAIGHFFLQQGWLNINPDYFHQMQGVELPYSLWLMIGTNIMMLATVALGYDVAKRYVNRWLAALLVYTIFVGTPLLYFSTVDSMNSHSPGTFMTMSFIWLLLRRERLPWWGWILTGIVTGLAVQVRWQLILLAAPGYLWLLVERRWRGFALATIAAAITLLPLPLIWNAMYGAPFVVPYNEVYGSAFLKTNNEWHRVLGYLLITSPVTILFFSGVVIGFFRERALTVVMVLMFAGQLYINGAAMDWYGGNSFGSRRMSELLPAYVLCAAFTYAGLEERLKNRPWALWAVRAIPVILIAFAFLYLLAFLSYIWTSPESWSGNLSPAGVIPYFLNQANRAYVVDTIFTTHLGPPAWTKPGP